MTESLVTQEKLRDNQGKNRLGIWLKKMMIDDNQLTINTYGYII